ncbi:MAG: transglutaminase [Daejeonella sp.]|nr:transglutaminase [Daejeonella sp.]
MKFNISSNLEYNIQSPSTIILNIHALRTSSQLVLEENLAIEPHIESDELISITKENKFLRINITDPVTLKISYNAVVDTYYDLTDLESLEDVPLANLGFYELSFLNPSRYCQSDKLYRFANNKFGNIDNAFLKVIAITDWIHKNVEYLSGSTNSQTSAYDTVTELAGVCRDFAHLGIALCRALTIPARYYTGYSYKLFPPDFHACFEAYLGGKWIIFDATKLVPLNGLVKISTGRDATDAPVASIFGNVQSTLMKINSECLEENFIPYQYNTDNLRGLSW